MQQKVFCFFKMLFAFVLGYILLLLIFVNPYLKYPCKRIFTINNYAITLIVFLFCAAACFLNQRFSGKIRCDFKNIIFQNDRFVYIIALILLFVQIYISYNIFFLTDWDAGSVNNSARAWASGNAHSITQYYNFSRYPNNLFLVIVQALILKTNNCIGIFQNDYMYMSIVCVNCLLNTLTSILVYKILKLYYSKKCAFTGFIISIALYGFSPWTIICYSDTMGIIFPVSCFYLYVRPAKSKTGKILQYVLMSTLAVIGYCIKPQCIIILIAIIIAEILFSLNKKSVKKLIAILCLIIYVFSLNFGLNAALNRVCKSQAIVLEKEKAFGLTHFAMMGLNQNSLGVYSQEDVDYSASFKTAQERKQANISKAGQRLQAIGPFGYLKHISKKALIAYNDGTFSWGFEGKFYYKMQTPPNSKSAPLLRSYYYKTGNKFKAFTLCSQFVWIFVLIFSFISVFTKKKFMPKKFFLVLLLGIIGLTAFQLIFEVRSRYLYTYLPLFSVLAAIGVKNFNYHIFSVLNKLKKFAGTKSKGAAL